MPIAQVIAAGLCLLWLVAPAAAAAAAPETTAKPSPRAPGQARIYFLRPKEFTLAALSSIDLLIDGRKIGELPSASYFVASRPPGHHTVEIQAGAGIFNSSWQSDVDCAVGQTVFLQLGPRLTGGIGLDLMNMILAGTNFQPLPGHGQLNFGFFSLDAEHGRAAIAKLKNATR